MGSDDLLTDDFVADLLAKEASDCSIKYSALGMEAFRSDKKPTNLPKPNTRFLRNIIKNTDSHNKALLAKEAAESKARLGDLEHTAEVKKQKLNPDSKTIRRRQMGDIHAILGGKRRSEKSESGSDRRRERDARPSSGSERRERERDRRRRSKNDLFEDGVREERHHGRLSRDDKDRDKRRTSDRRRTDDASDDEERSKSRRHRHRSRSRSRSPRHRSDARDKTKSRRHRSPVESRKSPPHRSRRKSPEREEAEDSDPLEDLIGPAPAPKYRGRGTIAGSSGIDKRFSESYDPKTDVDMDEVVSGKSNWEDEVEAFRDRQKLRQSQEERLRAAGFGDDQIHRIHNGSNGGTEDEANVRWSKAGEKREWDEGKEAEDEPGKQPSGLFSEFSDG